jgi:hypothetical protein
MSRRKLIQTLPLRSLLLQESTWKIILWTTFVTHIMQIIQRKLVHSSLIHSREWSLHGNLKKTMMRRRKKKYKRKKR